MKEKLKKAWLKVGKFLLWALLAALCCFVTYMVFTHRKLIRAFIKGEKLPEPKEGSRCPRTRKKK